jgi:hypothetical protein
MEEVRAGLNQETETTLEIEAPTPVSTPRPGHEVPAPARPEGPLELVYPPRPSRVLYCEVRADRSALAEKVRYRSHREDPSPARRWKTWPIEFLIALAVFSLIGLH